MRRAESIFCVLIFMLCLCSCSADEYVTTTAVNATEPASITTAKEYIEMNNFYIKANGKVFTAKFADNSSAAAFRELLEKGDLILDLSDYGSFEKVGPIGYTLPRNDEQVTTEPGDVILYQGSQITIYYDTNSWSFTRLGKIENTTRNELLSAFGNGDVTVTFSINN